MKTLVLLLSPVALGCAAELLVGPFGIGWPSDPAIAWQLRLPRLMLALGAGSGLAAAHHWPGPT